jgi:hypothetical protein
MAAAAAAAAVRRSTAMAVAATAAVATAATPTLATTAMAAATWRGRRRRRRQCKFTSCAAITAAAGFIDTALSIYCAARHKCTCTHACTVRVLRSCTADATPLCIRVFRGALRSVRWVRNTRRVSG